MLKYTGFVNFTPQYVYLRKSKCGKFISEIYTLPVPAAHTKKFIRILQGKARLKGLSEKVIIKDKVQYFKKHFTMEDVSDDFDVDFDLK